MLGLRQARFCCSGAAPIGTDLLRFFQGLGLPLREGFGMTETAGIASVQPLKGSCVGRVGFPIPGTEVRIAEDGELLIQGPHVFSGYYKMPEETRKALRVVGNTQEILQNAMLMGRLVSLINKRIL